jgi:U3 small nucleolar RNA-associated protein 7
MATSGHDRKLKVYDLRMYKALYEYRVAAPPAEMAFSQRGMLAASIGSVVQVGPPSELCSIRTLSNRRA